jgi:ketosteroid isomerase-like protein
MSSPEQNLALVRDGLAAFQRGDIEAFLEFLDPKVEIVSPADLPNPVRTTGREGYVQWVGPWLEAWERFTVEAHGFEPVGERHVLIELVQHGVGKGSGIEVEMPVIYMIEVGDGKATRLHLYADREQAIRAAEAGEAG